MREDERGKEEKKKDHAHNQEKRRVSHADEESQAND